MNDRKWPGAVKRFAFHDGEYWPIIEDSNGREIEAVWAPMAGSQCILLWDKTMEVLYEGNRGGGKTDTLIMSFLQNVEAGWGADWRGVIFRQTHPMLDDVIAKTTKWIKRIYGNRAKYNQIKYTWEWDSGEKLFLRSLEQEGDFDKFIGHSYTWIGWEELVLWANQNLYNKMFTCLRSTREGIPLMVRSTTNPYGIGHNWVQERFKLYNWPRKDKTGHTIILGDLIEGDINPITKRKDPPRRVIHSDLAENKILEHTQPDYRDNISKGAKNEAERKAWVDGSWDITAGGMFDDIWGGLKDGIVVPSFQVPTSWRITRALDYGSAKPFSIGWYAESDGTDLMFPDGTWRSTVRGDLFRIKEWYGWTGQPDEGQRLLVAEIVRGIIEREIRWGFRTADGKSTLVRPGPADTQIFDDVNGVCIANDFEKSVLINGNRFRGIVWEKADKGPGSREQGWEQLRKRLKATARPPGSYREIPGLFICQCCEQWIRTVPSLPRDKDHIDDVDTDAEDHVGDETRYRLRFENRGFGTRRLPGFVTMSR